MIRTVAAVVLATGFMTSAFSTEGTAGRATLLAFSDLKGWAGDDHAAALKTFRNTCGQIDGTDWQTLCGLAGTDQQARAFFELFFRPVLIDDGDEALFTAYYEPELPAARTRSGNFQYPLYRVPPEMPRGQAWFTRRQLEDQGILRGRGLEIAWLNDPVDRFFLHVQGSGRLRLTDGTFMRVGFAAKNGHPYRSVGREMARRGALPANRVSAGNIKAWVRQNPDAGRRYLQHNPSYIFFREVEIDADLGPIGAMGQSITAMRTVAVDPDFVTLGAPVWIETTGQTPLRRLMVAQDTGSAIKGAQRADIFFGSGDEAGDRAGIIRDNGRVVVLLPVERALKITGGS
ncbi:MAG: MltA domain-containing protein [Pseudomonadota bacterium]